MNEPVGEEEKEGGNGQEKNKPSSLARFCWPAQEFPTIGSIVGNARLIWAGAHIQEGMR